MPISKKKSIRKAASAAKKAAPAKPPARLGAAGRKRISSTAKRLLKEIPIRQRIESKRAKEQEMAAELPLTNEPWLTLTQIAARLGYSKLTVRNWTRVGGLRYRRFKRTIKVPLSELERWSGGISDAA